jgi:hypothetical protein
VNGRPIDPRDYVRRLLEAVENAFVLAATRRMIRPAGAARYRNK